MGLSVILRDELDIRSMRASLSRLFYVVSYIVRVCNSTR